MSVNKYSKVNIPDDKCGTVDKLDPDEYQKTNVQKGFQIQ